MGNPFSRRLLEQQPVTCQLLPCVVTSLSPLQISILDATAVPAVAIAGCDYSLGPANALFVQGSTPVVLPIG